MYPESNKQFFCFFTSYGCLSELIRQTTYSVSIYNIMYTLFINDLNEAKTIPSNHSDWFTCKKVAYKAKNYMKKQKHM